MNTKSEQQDRLSLMVWLIHRFADVFQDKALLKGGMQLALLASERATNDLDYVFAPFGSKLDVADRIEAVLRELQGAEVERSMHSTSGRFVVRSGGVSIQIEFNVDTSVPSEPVTTALVAHRAGVLPQVVRVMGREVALAHKLAAWNERRLPRDIYDAYYWYAHVGAKPDLKVLSGRLAHIQSRLPRLRRRKQMSLPEFCDELQAAVEALDQGDLEAQLGPLLPPDRLDGLLPVMRTKLSELIQELRR